MPEYIAREAAISESLKYNYADNYDKWSLECILKSIPAADVVEVLPELRKAVERLSEEYKKATQLAFVRDPLAYALHKTWRAADAKKIGGRDCC